MQLDITFVTVLSLISVLISLSAILILWRTRQKNGFFDNDFAAKGFVSRVTTRRTYSTPKAYLTIIDGSGFMSGRSTFELYGTTPIGRSRRHAELIFQATEEASPISRLHCTILDDDGIFFIRDEDSQWGSFLNGEKLEPLEGKELHDADIIELAQVERGGMRFRFSLAEEQEVSKFKSSTDFDTNDEEGRMTKARRSNPS
jgi:pSer/pThr/pTyr-binding forkhead associated (FHA) protein